MAAGYVLWLAGITAVSVVVPMQRIILAAGVLAGLVTITAFARAIYFKKSDDAQPRSACGVRLRCPVVREHLLPYDFSELMRKSTPMMRSATTFLC